MKLENLKKLIKIGKIEEVLKILKEESQCIEIKKELEKWLLEKSKFEYDFCKHLSSLNTVAILIMFAFFSKLTNVQWSFLIGVSLIAFIISVLTCLVLMLIYMELSEDLENWRISLSAQSVATTGSVIFFLTGILILVVVLFKNLY